VGERAAYIRALRGVLQVFGLYYGKHHHGTFDPDIHDWLDVFVTHLNDLNTGTVHPIFQIVRSNALPTSEWMKRVGVVRTTELFHAFGMKYEHAACCAIIAYELEGYCSVKEVLSWRKEFERGNVKNRKAAESYKRYMRWLKNSSSEKITKEVRELGFPDGNIPDSHLRRVVDWGHVDKKFPAYTFHVLQTALKKRGFSGSRSLWNQVE
jgi:hypothetical protein